MADEPVRLSPRVEEMLTASALPERDWEADARAIEARLKDVGAGSTEARWLDAPFPDEVDAEARSEGATEAAAATSATEAQATPAATQPSKPPPPSAASAPKNAPSLADLARSVAAKGSRPQATDIAKESLSVAAAARSHSDAIVERVRGSRAASPRVAPPRMAPPPAPSQRAGDSEPAPRPAPPARADHPRSQALPWIAVGGLGVLVIVLLVGKVQEPAAPTAAPAQASAEAAPLAQANPPSTAAAAAAPARAEPAPAVPAEEMVAAAEPIARSAGGLPPSTVRGEPHSGPAPAAANATPIAKSAPATPAAGTHPTRPEPEKVVLEDTPARAKGGATAANSALRPAAGSPAGGLPDRPTSGAVQAAIGSVMGGARTCVAGTTGATPAQVTFGSDGAVKAVTVSGTAAGTPAAGCIESALKRARVAPFASPTFTLMVWVRP